MKRNPLSRRDFLKAAAAAAAALGLPAAGVAHAAALPEVSATDPTAQSLGYVASTAKLDPAKEPVFKKGSTCANCALYQAAEEQNGLAPCAIFPGKSVRAAGWCRAWAAKPA